MTTEALTDRQSRGYVALSTEPFKARFTFTIGDAALTLTVDDDMNVLENGRHDITESV